MLARTRLVNTLRGIVKSFGARCDTWCGGAGVPLLDHVRRADLAARRPRSDFQIYFPIPASRQGPDRQTLLDVYGARLEIRFGP